MTFSKTAWILVVFSISLTAACGSGSADSNQIAPDVAAEIAPTPEVSAALTEEGDPSTAVPVELAGSWILLEIDGEAVTEAGKTPSLDILEDGSVAGVGGVNRFHTQLEVLDGRMSLGPIAATKMAGPPEAMDLESAFLTRLGGVSTFEIEGDTLLLRAGDNQALTFERKVE